MYRRAWSELGVSASELDRILRLPGLTQTQFYWMMDLLAMGDELQQK